MDMQQLLAAAQQMQEPADDRSARAGRDRGRGHRGRRAGYRQVNGQGELVDLTIAPEAIDPADPEETAQTIADLVLAAVRDAYRAAGDLQQEKMGPLAGGLGGPGDAGILGRRTAGGESAVPRTSPARARGRSHRGDPRADVYEGSRPGPHRRARPAARRRAQERAADRVPPAGGRPGRRTPAGRRAGRGQGEGQVLPDLRQRRRGGAVPDLPRPAPRPVGDLRGRGAQGRRRDRADPRVPRPLPRARRGDQPDRRHRPRPPADPAS